jgi:HSP20 family molecular chaperone IbpA
MFSFYEDYVSKEEDHVLIKIPVPGVKSEDLKIKFSEGYLNVKSKDKNFYLNNQYKVNTSVFDVSKIEATHELGIISIRVYKKEEVIASEKEIEIKVK